MNETHENITQEKAKKQLINDRNLLLKGAVAAIAKEENVSVKQIEVVETTKTRKNWLGKIKEIETTYAFRVKHEVN